MEGAVAPAEWYVSRVCEEFNCLPSQVLEEDAELISDVLALRNYARTREIIKRPDSDEDTLDRAGISGPLSELVMSNIKRAAGLRTHG